MKKNYLLGLLLFFLSTIATYGQEYRYVNADKLNLRSEPSPKSEVLLILYNTAEVELIEEVNENWAKVKAYGVEGYVASLYLVYDIGERTEGPYYSFPEPKPAAATPSYSNSTQTIRTYQPATRTKRQSEATVMICVSKSAYAYHAYQCRGLSRCTHSIESVSVSEARSRGYSPCKNCY